MGDTRKVERAAQQTHEPHPWACHALRPGLRYKQAEQDEIALRRVKVELHRSTSDPAQERTLRVTPCAVALSGHDRS